MARPPQKPSGGAPSPESSRPARNLYLIELLLGGGLLVLVVAIFFANDGSKGGGSGTRSKPAPGTESANIVTLTAENWQREVVDSPVPVVVDFWAPWCGPCVRLSPIIEQVAANYGTKVKFGKLNVDDAKEIADHYGAPPIPLVCVFKGGARPRARLVGCTPDSEERITSAIESALE